MRESIAVVTDILQRGGAVNWIITALYLVVIIVTVERAAFFLRTRYRRNKLFEALERCIADEEGIVERYWSPHDCRSQPIQIVRIFVANRTRPAAVLNEVLDRSGHLLRSRMEKRVEILSFIGAIAPFAGLLGTVIGLIKTFNAIETLGGTVDIAVFSGGIWEAMISTATGLSVAIPAVVFHRVYEAIIESRNADMSYTTSLLLEYLREDALPHAGKATEKNAPHVDDTARSMEAATTNNTRESA